MEVRDARPADADDIRAVHRAAIEELGPQAYTQEQVDAWARGCDAADYEAAVEAAEAEFVVAEREAAVVGFGSLSLTPPEASRATVDAEVTGVYVHPSVTRKGIGTALYTELEQRARAHGVRTLGLSASLNAVEFYQGQGYERVRTYTHEFSSHADTGVTGDVVEMKKEL